MTDSICFFFKGCWSPRCAWSHDLICSSFPIYGVFVYQELATCQEFYIAHLILSLSLVCVLFVFTTCESACVEVDGCMCASVHTWRSEGNFGKSVLSLHHGIRGSNLGHQALSANSCLMDHFPNSCSRNLWRLREQAHAITSSVPLQF